MIGADFDHFCRLIRERSGLVLTADKDYLLRSRLDPVARSNGVTGVVELLALVRRTGSESLLRQCVEALATHESSFFRDATPFEVMAKTVLPELVAQRRATRSIRIWCAACSSGQEPYTVAMVLQEMGAALAGVRTEIVATDLSKPILEKAQAGVYSDFEVRRGLTPERLSRWFVGDGGSWRVSPVLRQMVTFRTHNLLQGAAAIGRFDVVLCRNVLIYFDLETRRKVLDDLARTMAPDGALFLGSAETILGVTQSFEALTGLRGIFRPAAATNGLRKTA